MQLVRRFRIPALFCALCVLVCELISRPFADMGVSDEAPYFVMARHFADTGHVFYNGWAAPMLTWQLDVADVFIKLFGFSFTAIRSSTILVAMAMAFVLQRLLVRADISERNATIGTLALVLSPLYLVLSATFMTDIHGLFAMVLCLYGCLRAVQASTARAAIAWICFAIVTNALCGTSRQIAWLGILVMVPSALWLLRSQRRVLAAGVAATLLGIVFIAGCMHWLKQQPYITPERLIPLSFPVGRTLAGMIYAFLDLPCLLLPIAALFLPEIRKSPRRLITLMSVALLFYISLALFTHPPHHLTRLEPTMKDAPGGNWITTEGAYEAIGKGSPPIAFGTGFEVLLTLISLGGVLGLISSLLSSSKNSPAEDYVHTVSWHQLGILLVPFSIAYTLLLIPRATTEFGIFDRYLLELMVVLLLCLCRYYQQSVRSKIPVPIMAFTALMAVFGICVTHNTFAIDRARVALAAELHAHKIPDTSVDYGWEYNLGTELQHAPAINYPTIAVPANFYVRTPVPPKEVCSMAFYDYTPHIHPLYGVSFDPTACHGSAPFAPVHYSRWPYPTSGTLYVVRYTPPSHP